MLADDGHTIVVASRTPEPALVVRFDPGLARESLVIAAARIGHALGNQHTPIEAADGELRVPVWTSAEVVRATIDRLGLAGVEIEVSTRPLGVTRPLE